MLYLLGTGAAVSDAERTTTMLAVHDAGKTLLVDCGGDALQRLMAAGLGLDTVHALVVTHEHADHVAGFPLLVEKLYVYGRKDPLPVYGIPSAIGQAKRVWEAFDTASWDVFDLAWHEVEERPLAPVFSDDVFEVVASPVQHSVPNVGLRVTLARSGHTFAYSCDTEPCEAVVELARGTNLLVHEATGEGKGHSSAEQAAEAAQDAAVPLLVLVHLPPGLTDDALAPARALFPATALGKEGGRLRF